MTAFTRMVGCRVAIQQAPMGTVSSPDLAVAVADAGGVGMITAMGMDAATLDGLLADMSSRTLGVLGANFLTHGIDRDAVAAAARRVRLVDFFWTDPDSSLVEIVHREGALVSWQVGSLEEARVAADAGSDLIVVQGTEAGGHIRGDSAMLPLLDVVLDHVDVPVLAAGGIVSGRTLAAVLAAGAAGARIGTRFIATQESGAHPDYKDAVIAAGPGSTEISDQFADCPLCATLPRARVLSSCVASVGALASEIAGETRMGDAIVPVTRHSGLPPGAAATGHIDAMAMYAGEGVIAVNAVETVATVIDELTMVAEQLLAHSSAISD